MLTRSYQVACMISDGGQAYITFAGKIFLPNTQQNRQIHDDSRAEWRCIGNLLILKQDLAGRIFASALFLVHIVVDGLNVQKSLLKAGVIILHASQHSDTVTPCQLFTGHFEHGRNVKNGQVEIEPKFGSA